MAGSFRIDVGGASGFPSPADDYKQGPLDFNGLLVSNPPATFVVRVKGPEMQRVGIFAGDVLVVDRSLPAVDKAIVVAIVDGEFMLRRYRVREGKVWLAAEHPHYGDIAVREGMDFELWGVVRHSIRKHVVMEG